MSKGDGAGYLIAGAAVGLFAYFNGLKTFALLKKIENTPTCRIIAAYPGTVELEGKAKRMDGLLASPYKKKPCVYYKTVVSKWEGSGKHRKLVEVDRKCSDGMFLLQDDTGEIRIDPKGLLRDTQGIEVDAAKSVPNMPSRQKKMGVKDTVKWMFFLKSWNDGKSEPLTDDEKKDQTRAFIAENYPSLRGYRDEIVVEETYVEEGDPLYVIGTASNDDWHGGGHLVVQTDNKKPFYITDGTEKNARKRLGMIAHLSLWGGPVLFAVCAILLFVGYLKADARFSMALFGSLALLMYGYAALIHLLEMYNGIVLLRTQIGMAEANLDALYRRRHDLVPELENVVKGAAKHEKNMQKMIADLKKSESGGKSLLAVLERYPALRANENFLLFQKQLSETEAWIAGGRSFLADSITLYNTRIQVFPYSLFAGMAGFKPASLDRVAGAAP